MSSSPKIDDKVKKIMRGFHDNLVSQFRSIAEEVKKNIQFIPAEEKKLLHSYELADDQFNQLEAVASKMLSQFKKILETLDLPENEKKLIMDKSKHIAQLIMTELSEQFKYIYRDINVKDTKNLDELLTQLLDQLSYVSKDFERKLAKLINVTTQKSSELGIYQVAKSPKLASESDVQGNKFLQFIASLFPNDSLQKIEIKDRKINLIFSNEEFAHEVRKHFPYQLTSQKGRRTGQFFYCTPTAPQGRNDEVYNQLSLPIEVFTQLAKLPAEQQAKKKLEIENEYAACHDVHKKTLSHNQKKSS